MSTRFVSVWKLCLGIKSRMFFHRFDMTMLCKGFIGAVSWCGWKIESETKLFNSTAHCISHKEIILLNTDD